jgi:hypothetical protein
MNERTVATGLFLPPFLYVAARILPLFPENDVGVYFAFGTCLAIALILGLGSSAGQLVAVVLDLVLVALVLLALVASATFGSFASQLTAGVLVGLPFLVSALAWRERTGLAHRTVALAAAITLGTALLAARATVLAVSASVSPTGFVEGFFTCNLTQIQGLLAIASGMPTPALPLRAVFDTTFVALCALAVGGVLLLALRPRTGAEESLPVATVLERTGRHRPPEREIPFSAAQQRVFANRAADQPPTGAWPPGLGSVLVAALAGGAFIALAFVAPFYAPLVLAAVVGGVLLGVAAVSSRARSVPRLFQL